MLEVDSWLPGKRIALVESRGGVLATVNALDGLVRRNTEPWPSPEVMQKLYASGKFRGKTTDDDVHARRVLGHYSDLQSLSSEDAITWSFFGPLVYSQESVKLEFAGKLFTRLGLLQPRSIAIWLWRRIPHPEKLESQGGPEIDFGLLSDSTLVLGEAKWNSALGKGQGVNGDRTQQDLRRAYCDQLGGYVLPNVRQFCVLGVGRKADVLDCTMVGKTEFHNLTWRDILSFLPAPSVTELAGYLAWKEKWSR